MLAQRGINTSYETIRWWTIKIQHPATLAQPPRPARLPLTLGLCLELVRLTGRLWKIPSFAD
jgi:hypothetical protein